MTTARKKVYLLHIEPRLHHAGHYLGITDDVDRRVGEHLSGSGSPLVRAAVKAGAYVTLVRTWPKGGAKLERKLKRRNNTPRLCPVCSSKPSEVSCQSR